MPTPSEVPRTVTSVRCIVPLPPAPMWALSTREARSTVMSPPPRPMNSPLPDSDGSAALRVVSSSVRSVRSKEPALVVSAMPCTWATRRRVAVTAALCSAVMPEPLVMGALTLDGMDLRTTTSERFAVVPVALASRPVVVFWSMSARLSSTWPPLSTSIPSPLPVGRARVPRTTRSWPTSIVPGPLTWTPSSWLASIATRSRSTAAWRSVTPHPFEPVASTGRRVVDGRVREREVGPGATRVDCRPSASFEHGVGDVGGRPHLHAEAPGHRTVRRAPHVPHHQPVRPEEASLGHVDADGQRCVDQDVVQLQDPVGADRFGAVRVARDLEVAQRHAAAGRSDHRVELVRGARVGEDRPRHRGAPEGHAGPHRHAFVVGAAREGDDGAEAGDRHCLGDRLEG